ncbi:hypothetical protein FQN54_003370 [Arachnomyces sp. PD_36]|nr:hypothetical protein FQN54_003370 [Arachnomyces sp. PD_36]
MAADTQPALSPQQVEHFLQNGYVHLTGCFSREQAAEWTRDLWTRLGYSPTDKSTWTQERINMPSHRTVDVQQFAPTAWKAICQLLGGEERVSASSSRWTDGLIVNLGDPSGDNAWVQPRDLKGWHVDGDFFMHYLDSPEQALLVIPLFSDIKEKAGGTMISPDGIELIAKHLYEHPEGVSPRMTPRGQPPIAEPEGLEFYNNLIQERCSNFVEATGQVGDVYLLHPLMLHTASRNALRIPRIITNPKVSVKEPFRFDRSGKGDDTYSIVEQKTLRAIGKPEGLPGWKITAAREEVIPERVRIQAKMREEELQRLKEKGLQN